MGDRILLYIQMHSLELAQLKCDYSASYVPLDFGTQLGSNGHHFLYVESMQKSLHIPLDMEMAFTFIFKDSGVTILPWNPKSPPSWYVIKNVFEAQGNFVVVWQPLKSRRSNLVESPLGRSVGRKNVFDPY